MNEPITLTFYDENSNPIKTYSRSHISWGFFKKALNASVPEDGILRDENINTIAKFICDFYDNQFSEDDVINHTDVREVLGIVSKASCKVAEIMQEQGIKFPNVQAATN